MSEHGFNVPPIPRPYRDGTSVQSLILIQKTGEVGNKTCNSCIGSLAPYHLHY